MGNKVEGFIVDQVDGWVQEWRAARPSAETVGVTTVDSQTPLGGVIEVEVQTSVQYKGEGFRHSRRYHPTQLGSYADVQFTLDAFLDQVYVAMHRAIDRGELD